MSARAPGARMEALFWMTRLGFVWAPMLVPPGWFAAVGPHRIGGLVAAMAALGCAGAIVAVLNDVLDREKDRVTAPHLPLPSGLVTVPEALAWALLLSLGFLVGIAIAADSLHAFAAAVAAAAGAGLLVVAYSAAKRFAPLAMFLAAVVYADIPFVAWCAGGGHGLKPLAAVLGYTVFFGLGTNTYTGMQDVSTDPSVGNSSLAARFGLGYSFVLAAAFDLASVACVVVVAVQIGRGAVGAVLAAICVATILFVHWRHRRAGGWNARVERSSWIASTRAVTLSRLVTLFALVAVFSIPAALAITVVLAALMKVLTAGYQRRIVLGGLRRQALGPG